MQPRNYSSYISVIIILIMITDFFVKGGTTEASFIRKQLTAVTPIMSYLGVITLFRMRYRQISGRRPGWRWAYLFFITFAVVLAIGLILPNREKDPGFAEWINMIDYPGGQAMNTLMCFTIGSAFFRIFLARSLYAMWLMFFTLTSIVTISPIADMILPPWAELGLWVQSYPNAACDQVSFWPLWFGMFVLFINVVLLRERIKPGAAGV
jgi:hypothetical protein